jgi:hypothetical protein
MGLNFTVQYLSTMEDPSGELWYEFEIVDDRH